MDQMDQMGNPTAQKLMEAFMGFRRLGWRQHSIGGLTPTEIIVLLHIKKAVERDDAGVKVSEISGHMNVASPTITQQINNLETQGFVGRSVDKEDRRVVRVRLTDKGESILKMASEHFLASITGLVNYLGQEDSEELARLLAKVAVYFQEFRETSSAATQMEVLAHD